MTREELEIKAEQIKAKYIDHQKKLALELFNKVEGLLYEGKGFTEKEIQEKIETDKHLLQESYDNIDTLYEINNMCNHDAVFYGINIKEQCEDMRGLSKEKFRAIMFDSKGSYLGYHEAEGEELGLPKDIAEKVIDEAVKNKECKKIITIHNHPELVCATPSSSDKKSAIALKVKLAQKGIDLIDNCIISELDFYSMSQEEKNNEE